MEAVAAIAAWSGVAGYGAIQGWWLHPIAPRGDARAFMQAASALGVRRSMLTLACLAASMSVQGRAQGIPERSSDVVRTSIELRATDQDAAGSVVAAKRLRDGRLVVVMRRPAEIREYRADGTFVATRSRIGSGPGEFREIAWAGVSGDSLILFDPQLLRLSWIDTKGWRSSGVLGTTARPEGRLRVLGLTADGQLIASLRGSPVPPAATELVSLEEEFYSLDTAAFAHWAPLKRRMASAYLVAPVAGGATVPYPLRRTGLTCVGPHAIAAAYSDSTKVSVYAATGAEIRVIDTRLPRRRLDAERFDASLRRQLADAMNRGDSLVASMRSQARFRPQLAPLFSAIACSPERILLTLFTEDRNAETLLLAIDWDARGLSFVPINASETVHDFANGYLLTSSSRRAGDALELIVRRVFFD